MPPIKNLVTAITKGWADCSPILVAADADDHNMAKKIPAVINCILFGDCPFTKIAKISADDRIIKNDCWLLFTERMYYIVCKNKYMKNLTFMIVLFCCCKAFSQDLSLYQKREYKNGTGQVLPYRILYPDNYDKSKKYPVILFLHGAGERGNDNEKQLVHGAKLFLADSNRKNFPCFVIFPQCPAESAWSSVKVDRSTTPVTFSFDYTVTPNWPLVSAIEMLKQTVGSESIDKSRIYITGLSMGGMGTFEAVYRNPDLFAAAMPICGGGDTVHYNKTIHKTSFWIFHGAADAVVSVKESQAMVNKLNSLDADVTYTEYPGVNHNSWDNAFAEATYISWMFSHQRKKVKW